MKVATSRVAGRPAGVGRTKLATSRVAGRPAGVGRTKVTTSRVAWAPTRNGARNVATSRVAGRPAGVRVRTSRQVELHPRQAQKSSRRGFGGGRTRLQSWKSGRLDFRRAAGRGRRRASRVVPSTPRPAARAGAAEVGCQAFGPDPGGGGGKLDDATQRFCRPPRGSEFASDCPVAYTLHLGGCTMVGCALERA